MDKEKETVSVVLKLANAVSLFLMRLFVAGIYFSFTAVSFSILWRAVEDMLRFSILLVILGIVFTVILKGCRYLLQSVSNSID